MDSLWTPHGGGLEWMRTRDRLGMDWTRSGWTTGGLHVDSHRIPGGVKYTETRAQHTGENGLSDSSMSLCHDPKLCLVSYIILVPY